MTAGEGGSEDNEHPVLSGSCWRTAGNWGTREPLMRSSSLPRALGTRVDSVSGRGLPGPPPCTCLGVLFLTAPGLGTLTCRLVGRKGRRVVTGRTVGR